MPSADQLQTYAAAYRQAQQEAHRVADPLSETQFNWKPSAKAWSVGECMAHLNTVAAGYVPALEEAVVADDAPRGTPPFRYGWISRLFIRSVRPGGRAIPTATSMKPPEPSKADRSQIEKGRAMDGLDAWTDRYVAVIERAEGLDLARIKVRSPFMRLMRLPVGAFLDALGQHALRHVRQAERVTQHAGFPAA